MIKISDNMKATVKQIKQDVWNWIKQNPWRAAESILRFAPLISVSMYIGFVVGRAPSSIDAYVIAGITVVTLGLWGFAESKSKRFGQSAI